MGSRELLPKRNLRFPTTERIKQLQDIFDEAHGDLKDGCIEWRNKNNRRVIWIPSKAEVVFDFLSYKKISNTLSIRDIIEERTFYDIGAGDGRILFVAREAGAPEAVGYEINVGLWSAAKELHSSNKLLREFTNIDYLNADFFKEELDKKPGLYYIWPDANTNLDDVCKKIRDETPESLLIVYSKYIASKQKQLLVCRSEFIFDNAYDEIGLYIP